MKKYIFDQGEGQMIPFEEYQKKNEDKEMDIKYQSKDDPSLGAESLQGNETEDKEKLNVKDIEENQFKNTEDSFVPSTEEPKVPGIPYRNKTVKRLGKTKDKNKIVIGDQHGDSVVGWIYISKRV